MLLRRGPTGYGHNGRVLSTPRIPGVRPLVVAVALALAGSVLAGCGGSGAKAEKTPTASPSSAGPSVPVPSGVTLTKPGSTLAFADTADVAYQPNETRSTVLGITVTKVEKASMSDFASYVLDTRTKESTPYYVHVKVTNLGEGDVGGTDIPLWAVDQSNTLIHSSSFTNTYAACPSPALPKSFAPQASISTCLVYLLPDHGTLGAVSFRPLQAYAGIEWKGPIPAVSTHPATTKKSSKKSSKKK